jgi:ketosteroid isomerase-like protein
MVCIPIATVEEEQMRILSCAALFWFAVAAPVSAQTAGAELMAPIQKFIDSFNKGDAAAAAATHAAGADLTIIDEVPPYLWRGSKAFSAWNADLESDAKKNGITEPMVTLSASTRTETNGDQAYVVVPAVYTFKQGGKAMREAAQMTFVLRKGASGWLIHGWTWTGPKPQAAATTAK